jgi:hypothetical protein
MKKILCLVLFFCFLFLSSTSALGYIGKSIRIMGMGDHLAGIVKDQDTDIYRNPAYLSFVEEARIFGQYNLYDHTELRIAQNFTNKKAGLLGFVLHTSSYGNLALVGKLKPSTTEKKSSSADQEQSTDYYVVGSSSSNYFDKKTIQGLKAVYAFTPSSTIRLGADFTYLKNYDRRESETEWTYSQRAIDSDELRYYREYELIRNSDDSPDAQRASLGAVITAWPEATLDLTLYYENLSYTRTASSTGESYKEDLRTDTTTTVYLFWDDASGATENRAIGLDANLKYRFPQKTCLALLLGVRYGESESSWSQVGRDTSYSSHNVDRLSTANASDVAEGSAFSVSIGVGVEKDFSRAIKVGAACRGHWDEETLDERNFTSLSNVWTDADSVIYRSRTSKESVLDKTANSYELIFPVGAEITLHKTITARFGGAFGVRRDETESGYSTSSYDQYYQGIRLSYDERIFMDAYIEEEIDRLGNWMVKLEYRF